MEWGGELRSDCCIKAMFDTGKQEEPKSGTGNREGKKVVAQEFFALPQVVIQKPTSCPVAVPQSPTKSGIRNVERECHRDCWSSPSIHSSIVFLFHSIAVIKKTLTRSNLGRKGFAYFTPPDHN